MAAIYITVIHFTSRNFLNPNICLRSTVLNLILWISQRCQLLGSKFPKMLKNFQESILSYSFVKSNISWNQDISSQEVSWKLASRLWQHWSGLVSSNQLSEKLPCSWQGKFRPFWPGLKGQNYLLWLKAAVKCHMINRILYFHPISSKIQTVLSWSCSQPWLTSLIYLLYFWWLWNHLFHETDVIMTKELCSVD